MKKKLKKRKRFCHLVAKILISNLLSHCMKMILPHTNVKNV